ncbi:MAG: hypothetical protein SGJ27_01895 [Candidatus Melainabacteria bacterium]|nr:hypothetical protein [Candidatus Melainabacteria bacterium]
MTKSPNQLLVTSSVALPALVEYLALCVGGWVDENLIRADANDYFFKPGSEQATEATVKKHSSSSAAESQLEALKFILGVHQLGGTVATTSGWTKKFPPTDLMQWLETSPQTQLHSDAPIIPETLLTLNALEKIYKMLAGQSASIKELLGEPDFNSLFPHIEFIAGQYEHMRHQSGNEVKILWHKRDFVQMHKIDAPNPVASILAAWLSKSGYGVIAQKTENCGIYNEKGYRGTSTSRWQISKMLGEVPAAHQSAAFGWASNAIWTIDEYHSTRGGAPLPDVFTYSYDDIMLTADRELVFTRSNRA